MQSHSQDVSLTRRIASVGVFAIQQTTPHTRLAIGALAFLTLVLCLLPWLFHSQRSREFLYASEAGIFEQLSLLFWIVLAVGLPAVVRPVTWRVIAASIACLYAAAREASFHTQFTGYSVLKIGYYHDASFPLLQRIGVGMIVAFGIACLLIAAHGLLRYFRNHSAHRTAWGQLFLLFLAVAATSKVLDRSPAILNDWFGVALPDMLLQMMQSCEEGLQLLLPGLLFLSAILFARSPARLRRLVENPPRTVRRRRGGDAAKRATMPQAASAGGAGAADASDQSAPAPSDSAEERVPLPHRIADLLVLAYQHSTRSARVTIVILAAWSVVLTIIPWIFTTQHSREMIYASEAGVFEELSLLFWIVLAPALLYILRPITLPVLAASIACLYAAAREADWHLEFTGYSVLKIGFYHDASYPILHRLGFGIIVGFGIACLAVAAYAIFRYFRDHAAYKMAWGQMYLIFLAAAAASKVLDRSPAIVADWFGIETPTMLRQMMQSNEEGIEMVLPGLLLIAAIYFARKHRRPPQDGVNPQPEPTPAR